MKKMFLCITIVAILLTANIAKSDYINSWYSITVNHHSYYILFRNDDVLITDNLEVGVLYQFPCHRNHLSGYITNYGIGKFLPTDNDMEMIYIPVDAIKIKKMIE